MGQGAGSVPAAQPVCNVYVCICVNAHVSMYAYVRACVHFSVCVSVCVCAQKHAGICVEAALTHPQALAYLKCLRRPTCRKHHMLQASHAASMHANVYLHVRQEAVKQR